MWSDQPCLWRDGILRGENGSECAFLSIREVWNVIVNDRRIFWNVGNIFMFLESEIEETKSELKVREAYKACKESE